MTLPRDPAVTARLQAEAEQALANARKANAEAAKFEAEARTAELARDKAEREERERRAQDANNYVYNFNSEVSETSVKNCMNVLSQWSRLEPGCDMTIRLNSPGGSVIDGMALYDHLVWLRGQGHDITIEVRGMAASMAGILLQAATHRVVGKEAWVLIHRASFGAIGKSFEVEDRVEWIKRIEARIIDIFVKRADEAAAVGTASAPLTKAKIQKNWDRKDWWLTSDECIRLGVADAVR